MIFTVARYFTFKVPESTKLVVLSPSDGVREWGA